jgi:hypothetical protein
MQGSAPTRRRSTKPWNGRAGVRGFASAALFYRSLLHRMPLDEEDRVTLRAHQDIHQAIGRLDAGDPAQEVARVSAWLADELARGPAPDDTPAYSQARLELLTLLSEALSKAPARPTEAAVFSDDPAG